MEKFNELALQVLQLAQTRVLSELRFMSGALTAVVYKETEQDLLFAVRGRAILYHPEKVLSEYRAEKKGIAAALLHVLFHCLMGHPFQDEEKDEEVWNLACDLAAEQIRMDLADKNATLEQDTEKAKELLRISDYAGGVTAEKYYNYFVDEQVSESEICRLSRLFAVDDHRFWSTSQKVGSRKSEDAVLQLTEEMTSSGDEEETEEEIRQAQGESHSLDKNEKNRKNWKKISRQVRTELELFQKKQGMRSGNLIQGMEAFLFEEVDYTQFLQIFGYENEVLQISEDEFDLAYYTYGLEKYGNVPLIEPLEYSNRNRIREFVIAIDTSGSVQGEIVEDFLRRTCNVLRQTNSFADKVNIYVIQCDAEIQNCTQITDLNDLERYIKDLQLYGFGGTDFRPVFAYVDQLLKERKLEKINGLLYFTDGVGIYPDKETEYRTAFIFNRDDHISPAVPEWAIKAVLTSDNIRMVKKV